MTPLTLQTTEAPAPTGMPPFSLDSGVAIVALLVLIVKEGVILIKKKEADEASLTSELIKDLRIERSEQLGQMRALIERLNTSHDRVAAAIHRMSVAIAGLNEGLTKQSESNIAIHSSIRQLDERLIQINQRIESIVYLTPENAYRRTNLQPQPSRDVRTGSSKARS